MVGLHQAARVVAVTEQVGIEILADVELGCPAELSWRDDLVVDLPSGRTLWILLSIRSSIWLPSGMP